MKIQSIVLFIFRLYCGGACSQSSVTVFLQFLKVGGFLIAPIGTKVRSLIHQLNMQFLIYKVVENRIIKENFLNINIFCVICFSC